MKKTIIFIVLLYLTKLMAVTFYLNNNEIIYGSLVSNKNEMLYIKSGETLFIVPISEMSGAFEFGENVLESLMTTTLDNPYDEKQYAHIEVIEKTEIEETIIQPVTKQKEVIVEEVIQTDEIENIVEPEKLDVQPVVAKSDTVKIVADENAIVPNQEIVINKQNVVLSNTDDNQKITNKNILPDLQDEVVVIKTNGDVINGKIVSNENNMKIIKYKNRDYIPLNDTEINYIFNSANNLLDKMENKPMGKLNNLQREQIIFDYHENSKKMGMRDGKKHTAVFRPIFFGFFSSWTPPVAGPIIATLIAYNLPVEEPQNVPIEVDKKVYAENYKKSRKYNRTMSTAFAAIISSSLMYLMLAGN